jgi:hypothetical protein
MSEVFEGILYPVESNTGGEASFGQGLEFEVCALGPGLRAMYRSDSRRPATFSEEVNKLAGELSRRHGRSLVIRFDSRVGHRSATLYVDGQRASVFGEADELFVPLDERGLPRTNEKPLRADQLAPDEEYETIQNAIQQGLKALGRGSWNDLFRLMTAG